MKNTYKNIRFNYTTLYISSLDRLRLKCFHIKLDRKNKKKHVSLTKLS